MILIFEMNLRLWLGSSLWKAVVINSMMEKERKNIEIDKYASRGVCESEREVEKDFYFNLYSFPCLLVLGICIVSAFDIFFFHPFS